MGADDQKQMKNRADAVSAGSGEARANERSKLSATVIAAMIPLIGIMLGILYNTYSENQARADEKTSRAREEQIRRVEIGIDIYKEAATAQVDADAAVEACLEDLDLLVRVDSGSIATDSEPVTTDSEPVTTVLRLPQCDELDVKLRDVEVALDRAILVSPDSLVTAVQNYKEDWLNWEEKWEPCFAPQQSEEAAEPDQENPAECPGGVVKTEDLKNAEKDKNALDASGDRLSETIRQIVLLQYSPEEVGNEYPVEGSYSEGGYELEFKDDGTWVLKNDDGETTGEGKYSVLNKTLTLDTDDTCVPVTADETADETAGETADDSVVTATYEWTLTDKKLKLVSDEDKDKEEVPCQTRNEALKAFG